MDDAPKPPKPLGPDTIRAREIRAFLRGGRPSGGLRFEFDAETGRHLGNFQQAFSRLALAEAATRIIVAEGLKEVVG